MGAHADFFVNCYSHCGILYLFYVLLCVTLHPFYSFAIILMWNRDLVALLSMSSWCMAIVVSPFLTVPWVCLQFVIAVSPVHTHLLFLYFCWTSAQL